MEQSLFTNPSWWFLLAWSYTWKGIALWKAGRNNQVGWFIALLLINLFGLPEILYLLFFQKDKNLA
jgi:hypothetical protein